MIDVEKLRKDLCFAGKLLAEKGLVCSNLGTISAVADRERGLFLAKPGPMSYVVMRPNDFLAIWLDGSPLEKRREHERVSMNWLVHRACYEARPDIGAVVHAHPLHVVALISQQNNQLELPNESVFRSLTGEFVWFLKPVAGTFSRNAAHVPIVDNLDPRPLAEAVRRNIVKTNIVAIRNHGIVAVGKDIGEATAAALVAEEEARLICAILMMGGRPDFLEAERVWHELKGMPPWFSKPFSVQELT